MQLRLATFIKPQALSCWLNEGRKEEIFSYMQTGKRAGVGYEWEFNNLGFFPIELNIKVFMNVPPQIIEMSSRPSSKCCHGV